MFDNPHLYCNLKTYYLKEVKMNYETVEENIRNYRDNNDSNKTKFYRFNKKRHIHL